MSLENDRHRFGPGGADIEALLAAGFVGTWNTDVAAGASILDPGAAALLAGNADLAGRPLPLEAALARIHEDDRFWVFERIGRARRTGGPFSAEFRVRTESGVRWVLNRGALIPDADGRMHGRGAYLDTTDNHGGPFLAPAQPQALIRSGADPLEIAARHAIAARESIERTGEPVLRLMADALLLEIGRALARAQRY